MKAEDVDRAFSQALGTTAGALEVATAAGMSKTRALRLMVTLQALGLSKCDLADLLLFLLDLIPSKNPIFRTARSLVRGAINGFKEAQGCDPDGNVEPVEAASA